MEVLASVSSVFSVVSLTFQLADGLQQLIDFWKSVQDAPDHIRDLFNDLQQLSCVLTDTRRFEPSFVTDSATDQIVKSCEKKILGLQERIESAIVKFNSKSQRRRTWAALRIRLGTDEILALRRSVSEVLAKLQIALITSSLYLFESRFHIQQQTLDTIQRILLENTHQTLNDSFDFVMRKPKRRSHPNAVVPSYLQYPTLESHYSQGRGGENTFDESKELTSGAFEHANPDSSVYWHEPQWMCQKHELVGGGWNTSVQTPFLTLHSKSKSERVVTRRLMDESTVLKRNVEFILHPPTWLVRFGFPYGVRILAESSSGWKYLLEPFRAVPKESLIFEFCRDGNLAGLRSLLKLGQASPWDRDPLGRTPLRVAVEYSNLDIAEFLLQQGADTEAQEWCHNRSPIWMVFHSKGINIEQKLSMIRLLQMYAREGYDDGTIYHLVSSGLMAYRPQKSINMQLSSRNDAALRIIASLVPRLHPKDSFRTRSLIAAIFLFFDQKVLQWMLHSMPDKIEPTDKGESVIHEAISRRLPERDRLSMEMLVRKTSDLHLCIRDSTFEAGKKPHTPTMLAMYDANLFFIWRNILVETGVDIAEFIRKELDSGFLRQEGWSTSSLTSLFEYQFKPRPITGAKVIGFPDCGRCGAAGTKISSSLMVDLEWRRTLQHIRRGTIPSIAKSHIREIVVSFGKNSGLQHEDSSENLSPWQSIEEEGPLPYRIVCSTECKDGICVAWMYEDVPDCEPQDEGSSHNGDFENSMECDRSQDYVSEADSHCPSRYIPGAFVD